jgi:hypothetical protein
MVDTAWTQLWRSVSDNQSRRKNLYACRVLMLRSSRLSIVTKTLRIEGLAADRNTEDTARSSTSSGPVPSDDPQALAPVIL